MARKQAAASAAPGLDGRLGADAPGLGSPRLDRRQPAAAAQRPQPSFRRPFPPSVRTSLRYELVHRFGGVYLGTDMECLRPLDGLLGGPGAFAGGEEPGRARQHHPRLCTWAPVASGRDRADTDLDPRARHRPTRHGARSAHRGERDHPEVAILPPDIFYPYRAHEPSRAGRSFPSAHAVHRWHGSWAAPGTSSKRTSRVT